MRSRLLADRVHRALKPRRMRNLLLVRRQQLVRSQQLIPLKKGPKPKSALVSSGLFATYYLTLFGV
jgi:hypothetical protein